MLGGSDYGVSGEDLRNNVEACVGFVFALWAYRELSEFLNVVLALGYGFLFKYGLSMYKGQWDSTNSR